MTRFCPRCGKKGIAGDFCSECTSEESGLSFKDINMKKCIFCLRFFIQHRWPIFETEIEGVVASAMDKIRNPKKVDFTLTPQYESLKNKPGASQDFDILCVAGKEEFLIPAKIDFTTCPYCSKEGTKYFEGDIQLRGVNQEVVDFVRRDIEAHRKDGVHITREGVSGTSADFQLTSAKYLRQLAKVLVQRYNGKLSETTRLFGRDRHTGKDIYRVSILFEMRNYKVGDIVENRGRKIKVKTIGKNVSGIDVETGKKVILK